MRMTGNTVLVTGGGSGIGRALAELFHRRGSKVIIAGRRPSALDEVTASNPGIEARALDLTQADSIAQFAARVRTGFPDLNVIIHNAGMMRPEQIGDDDVAVAEAIIATNLLGLIRLNSALMPLLQQQPEGAIMTVTSGLAFVPRADHPTYCATKAAIHSYTQSLRLQLAGTKLQVIELIPPYVQTELQGPEQASDPRAMPLADYIDAVTDILDNEPQLDEICVDRVLFQRTAESSGEYEARYTQINQRYGVTADASS